MSTMKSILILLVVSVALGWLLLSPETDYCAMQYKFFGKTESGTADVYGNDNQLLIEALDTNNDGAIDQEFWGYPQLSDGGNYFLKDVDFDGFYDEIIVMGFSPTYIDVNIPVPPTSPFICNPHNKSKQ